MGQIIANIYTKKIKNGYAKFCKDVAKTAEDNIKNSKEKEIYKFLKSAYVDYSSRGDCYVCLGKYKEAIADFTIAYKCVAVQKEKMATLKNVFVLFQDEMMTDLMENAIAVIVKRIKVYNCIGAYPDAINDCSELEKFGRNGKMMADRLKNELTVNMKNAIYRTKLQW